MKTLVIMVIIFSALFSYASGHGLGQSFEQKVGNYVIDVGYDAIDKIQAGDATRFDFNLWIDKENDKMADFDHVWVRISPQKEGIAFAGFLYRPEFLLTGMSYAFQKSGQYELTVRFLDKDDINLAEATFPLEVVSDESPISSLKTAGTLIGAIVGLIIGIGLSYFLKKRVSA